MSNLWFNIRFGHYHLQIGPDRPWVRWSRNSFWDQQPWDRWFEVYTAFGNSR